MNKILPLPVNRSVRKTAAECKTSVCNGLRNLYSAHMISAILALINILESFYSFCKQCEAPLPAISQILLLIWGSATFDWKGWVANKFFHFQSAGTLWILSVWKIVVVKLLRDNEDIIVIFNAVGTYLLEVWNWPHKRESSLLSYLLIFKANRQLSCCGVASQTAGAILINKDLVLTVPGLQSRGVFVYGARGIKYWALSILEIFCLL